MTAVADNSLAGGVGRKEWRTIILSSLGGALEFYDFVIYGVFAPVIGAAFFPAEDPLVSLTASYLVFAIGYLARPLGGIVLSHFGDRYGRRRVFITTMLAMSATTVAMGLLPGYATLGPAAAFAMIALRFLQGFCLGGELPGAITYVTETAPRRAGYAAGVIFFCVNTGVLLATLLNLGLNELFTAEQVGAFGWRIAFLLGGVLGLISFWLRLSLEETAEFQRIKHAAVKQPFKEVLAKAPVQVLLGVGAMICSGSFNGLLFGYIIGHMTKVLHYTPKEASLAQNVCLAVLSVGLVTVAWIGDRMPRRYFLGLGALLAAAFAFPFFRALEAGSMNLILLFTLAGVVASFFNGACVGVIGDLFPTRIRFSGVALGFNIAFSVGSGIAPLVATRLVAETGSAVSPAWYMVVAGSLTLIASLLLPRYEGQILREVAERDAQAAAAPLAQST